MIGLRAFVSLCGVAATALVAWKAPSALEHLDLFRVREIRVAGTRYLAADQVIAAAAVPPGASLWSDPTPWEEALRRHPLVRDARVRRRFPHTLVVQIVERRPVALLATPVLWPVDGDGAILPLDPAAMALDLPVIRPPQTGAAIPGRRAGAEIRALAAELERLQEVAPAFLATVSDLGLDGGHDIAIRLLDPPVELRYRPPLDPRRLRDGLTALRDAAARRADAVPAVIDLRFADQVIVRYAPLPARPANGS